MITVCAIHGPDDDHLAKVVEEMRVLGPPVIRVVDCGDHLMALEGSHRLAAAARLGLTPSFDVYEPDDSIDCSDFDWWPDMIPVREDGDDENESTIFTAAEVVWMFSGCLARPYSFDRLITV